MDCRLRGSSVYGVLQEEYWVATTFFRGSSRSRDQTWVSHTRGRFLTGWATREALLYSGSCDFYCETNCQSCNHLKLMSFFFSLSTFKFSLTVWWSAVCKMCLSIVFFLYFLPCGYRTPWICHFISFLEFSASFSLFFLFLRLQLYIHNYNFSPDFTYILCPLHTFSSFFFPL